MLSLMHNCRVSAIYVQSVLACFYMVKQFNLVQIVHQQTRIFFVSLSLDLTDKQVNTAVSTKMLEAKLSRNG